MEDEVVRREKELNARQQAERVAQEFAELR